jgi:glycosyltransferase involved in cell wall biosynthesis
VRKRAHPAIFVCRSVTGKDAPPAHLESGQTMPTRHDTRQAAAPAPAPAGFRVAYLSGGARASTAPGAHAGGARAHILGVIAGFEALGCTVDRFIVGDRTPARVVEAPPGIVTGSRPRRLAIDLVRLSSAMVSRRVAFRRHGGRVDLVYERFGAFQGLGSVFARAGIPWILELQSVMFEEAHGERGSILLRDMARRVELRAYRECDAIVCVSRTLKERLVGEYRVPARKVLVVPMAVDLARFQPPVAESPAAAEMTVVFAGELIERQRLDLLLQAVAALRDRDGVAIRVLVAGEGPCRAEWQRLATRLGLDRQVEFAGRLPMDRVPAFISRADLGYAGHAHTAGRSFSSPTKMYEYMAMARPVIASGGDDVAELVHQGVTGFLFEPGSADGLADALSCAPVRRPDPPSTGRAARALVERDHTWEARVRRMMEELAELLPGRVPAPGGWGR